MSKKKAGPGRKLEIAFFMDPIEKINLETDTTFLLMLEAQARKHRVYYFTPREFRIENGAPAAALRPVRVKRPASPGQSHYSLRPAEERPLSELDLVFMRVDPPYSLEYVSLCQALHLVPPPTVVVNRPRGILLGNEKFLALRFADLMPPTIVTHEIGRLREFLERVGGKMVLKPLAGFGGEGVVVVDKDHTNREALLSLMTDNGKSAVLAQKYLPVTSEGDKRIILLSGEPMGAVLRMPRPGDHRANLHAGGSYRKAAITDRDREICSRVGAWARREGLWIVGLDIIAGHLTEVNVTSPTLVRQINELEGVNLERRILDFCEYLSETARAQSGGA